MYKIEETGFGYRMTFEGFLNRSKVGDWVKDVKKQIKRTRPFGVVVDMQSASAFPADAQELLFEGIQYCRERGMERAAIAVANPITKIQAVRVAKETGIYAIVRYLDTSSDSEWEKAALDWVTKSIDPD